MGGAVVDHLLQFRSAVRKAEGANEERSGTEEHILESQEHTAH
jgi:hypothetical protein